MLTVLFVAGVSVLIIALLLYGGQCPAKPEPPVSSMLKVGAQHASLARERADWGPMEIAPRDGTVIELRCTSGVAPWYGLYQWTESHGYFGWHKAGDPSAGVSSEAQLTWRPFAGDLANYRDPTNGAQDTGEYWRGALAAKHGLPLDAFEKEVAKNQREREIFGDGSDAPDWPKSNLNGSFTLHRGVWVDDFVATPSDRVLDEFREQRKAVATKEHG